MGKTIFFGAISAWAITLMAPVALQPAMAETAPITEIRWWNDSPGDNWQSIQFTVPDQDTTKAADHSGLRRYDVHIAKLFALTDFLCQHGSSARWQHPSARGGINWSYEAANGNIAMGDFKISCSLARHIAIAYGLSQPEPTDMQITFNLDDGRPTLTTETYAVPSLNISGTKIPKWLAFTQTFRPQMGQPLPDVPFPVQSILSALKAKTQVPIFLPDHSFFEDIKQGNLEIDATPNGYTIDIYGEPNCRAGACYFGSFSAERKGQLFSPTDALPRDTFRRIELANGIEGIFFNGCGAYCTAFVEWRYGDVLYRVTGKNGQQQALVKAANAAIVAGSR